MSVISPPVRGLSTICPKQLGRIPPNVTGMSLGWSSIKNRSGYDQEIPQSQTADNPMAPRGRTTQPSRDIRKTN